MSTAATLTLEQMDRELYNLANSSCIDKDTREAARRAGDLLRGFRGALNLPWNTPAADLHDLAMGVVRVQ